METGRSQLDRARRGYFCCVTDALSRGDQAGAGEEGQQSLASNPVNLRVLSTSLMRESLASDVIIVNVKWTIA